MRLLWRAALLALAAFGLGAAAPGATPAPTATPTPRPKLSGGFGRAVVTPAEGASGQSLADIVRAAESTRSREAPEKKGGVKIDNNTLVTDPSLGRVTTSRAAPPLQPASAPGPVTPSGSRTQIAPSPTASPAPGGPSQDELKWREAARQSKKRVEEARQRVAELEASARKLENDFYAWDDGQYRDRVIKPAWDKTKEQLEAARRELADAEKDLADLPDRARKAGALPGWLRE